MEKNRTWRISTKLGKRRIKEDGFMDSKINKKLDFAKLEKLDKFKIDQT